MATENFDPIHWPFELLTSNDTTRRRLRVDVGQTGFFEGREFRSFKEINIAAGATLVFRVIVPVNTILQHVGLILDDGKIKMRPVAGGTPTGTFNDPLPIIPKNNMTGGQFPAPPVPLYVAQTTIVSGGTALTGGTDIDVLRLVVAGASGQASTVGDSVDDARGVAPGTYYRVLNNFGSGAATGVFSTFWEERA